MRTGIVAFIAGLLALRFLPELPGQEVLIACLIVSVGLIFLPRLYVVGAFLMGFGWACLSAQWALDDRLADALDGRVVWLEGTVVGLPELREGSTRFLLKDAQSRHGALPSRIRVTWSNAPALRSGERWRLAVELQKPGGLHNFRGMDGEAWMLAHRIGASGAVKAGQRLSRQASVDAWRDALRQRLLQLDAFQRNGGLAALVLGDGSGISAQDWQLLQTTGTTHLMVISGQHITLLSGFVFALVAGLARLRYWPARLPWFPIACMSALLSAAGYGFLAGFDVPVRRACAMIALVTFWRLRFRHLGAWVPVGVALAVVLAAEPLASLTPGFWLSFMAVGLLIWIFAGRLGQWNSWRSWGRAQWMMAIGLAPVLLALDLPVSLSGPVANLIAVPWVDFLVVPAALLGAVFLLTIPPLGKLLLWCSGATLDGLFTFLQYLSVLAPAWQGPLVPAWAVALGMLGVLLWLAPDGLPVRPLAPFLLVPLFWPPVNQPASGLANVVVLDVGQGLSVLIQTKSHSILYDAGPLGRGYDAGERVVVPNLRAMGIRHLDTMLISHGDADHAGGAAAVFGGIKVDQVITGEVKRLPGSLHPISCEDNQRWVWEGVMFTVWQPSPLMKGNAASCVLMVEAAGERLFLTGDIDEKAERRLIESGRDIHAQWLLAPHHGSRTASSESFLKVVRPEYALISRGIHNNFGHPHAQVISRYERHGVQIYDTALSGAISFTLGKHDLPQGARQKRYFWQEK
jgi:competence protein ComEC